MSLVCRGVLLALINSSVENVWNYFAFRVQVVLEEKPLALFSLGEKPGDSFQGFFSSAAPMH